MLIFTVDENPGFSGRGIFSTLSLFCLMNGMRFCSFFYPQKKREKERKTRKPSSFPLRKSNLQDSQDTRSLWAVYNLNVTRIPAPLFRQLQIHHPSVASQSKSADPESPPRG